MLAAKTFLKDVLEVSLLLQLSNITAVAYINDMWGKVSNRSGKGTMDVGTRQGHNLDSPTHPGSVSVRHCSRHVIADSPWQVRLDVLPSSHLSHPGSIRTTVCGSVCIQIDTSDTPLLQLETRPPRPDPPGVSSECIPTGLGPTERLCQPTMMHAIGKPNWCW